jgi:hypothetical protein
MNRSASGGLNFGIGFMKCCDMRTLAHECLVVPVACSARWLSRQCSPRAAACKSMVFWFSSASRISQRFPSEREDFPGMKTKPTQT